VIVFAVGSTDRLFFRLHISYTAQIHFWRIGIWVLPIVVFLVTRSVCRSLQRSEAHPLRSWQGEVVRRDADGRLEVVVGPRRRTPAVTEPARGTVPGHQGETSPKEADR
jgi:hypothetical protein